MFFFGLCFVIYFLKLSAGTGYNSEKTDFARPRNNAWQVIVLDSVSYGVLHE
jgi:hypothetical protein